MKKYIVRVLSNRLCFFSTLLQSWAIFLNVVGKANGKERQVERYDRSQDAHFPDSVQPLRLDLSLESLFAAHFPVVALKGVPDGRMESEGDDQDVEAEDQPVVDHLVVGGLRQVLRPTFLEL